MPYSYLLYDKENELLGAGSIEAPSIVNALERLLPTVQGNAHVAEVVVSEDVEDEEDENEEESGLEDDEET